MCEPKGAQGRALHTKESKTSSPLVHRTEEKNQGGDCKLGGNLDTQKDLSLMQLP